MIHLFVAHPTIRNRYVLKNNQQLLSPICRGSALKQNVKCQNNQKWSEFKVLEANVLYILHSGCGSLCRSARIANHSTHMSFLCGALAVFRCSTLASLQHTAVFACRAQHRGTQTHKHDSNIWIYHQSSSP